MLLRLIASSQVLQKGHETLSTLELSTTQKASQVIPNSMMQTPLSLTQGTRQTDRLVCWHWPLLRQPLVLLLITDPGSDYSSFRWNVHTPCILMATTLRTRSISAKFTGVLLRHTMLLVPRVWIVDVGLKCFAP